MIRQRRATFAVLGISLALIAVLGVLMPNPWKRVPDVSGGCSSPPPEADSGELTAPDRPSQKPASNSNPGSTSSKKPYRVRDIVSGAPRADLKFTANRESTGFVTTDHDGLVELPLDLPPSISDERWRLVSGDAGEVDDSGATPLWVSRRILVRGRVVASREDADQFSPAGVHVELLSMGAPGATVDSYLADERKPASDPQSSGWLRRNRVELQRPRRFDRVTGEFEFDCVAVPRMGLRARGGEWSCPTQAIRELADDGVDRVDVDIVVRRARRISGALLDEQGRPLPGGRISIRLRRNYSASALDPYRLADYGVGFALGSGPNGSYDVWIGIQGTIDSAGRFELDIPAGLSDWSATILGRCDGNSFPKRIDVDLRQDRVVEPIKLSRSDVQVVFRERDTVLDGARIEIADITFRDSQYSLGAFVADRGGRVIGTPLELGRDYCFFVARGLDARLSPFFVRWKGQPTLDVSSLHTNLTEFERDLVR